VTEGLGHLRLQAVARDVAFLLHAHPDLRHLGAVVLKIGAYRLVCGARCSTRDQLYRTTTRQKMFF
jgi:hypothetical protein